MAITPSRSTATTMPVNRLRALEVLSLPASEVKKAGQLAGGQHSLVAAALEGDPALGLPPAQGVDADPDPLGHLTDPQVVDHPVSIGAGRAQVGSSRDYPTAPPSSG